MQPDQPPRGSRKPAARRHRRGAAVLAALAAACFTALVAAAVAIETLGISPRLLAPYIDRRASGHNALIEIAAKFVSGRLLAVDRGELIPRIDYPDWIGTVARPRDGTPEAGPGRVILVGSPDAAARAIEYAEPGDVIEFLPGTYRFIGRALEVTRAGRAELPITVRAERLGRVVLEFAMLEGFHVRAPHWIFENLVVRGACASHVECEHAFHIVGPARNVVIRNNLLRDFNAHIKINGDGGHFPDAGQIVSNTLVNAAPRQTDTPVTPIDLVAASDWTIEANLIADFVKARGDGTSYGGFAKGGGANNRFIRNVVLCEHRLRGVPGRRVGLSLGGGGSAMASCRDRRCVVEHEGGEIAGNLIASCSDEGIYLNRAARALLLHNTVIDTAGVVVRYPDSSARAYGNLIDGPLRTRDGATLHAPDNRTGVLAFSFIGLHPVLRLFRNPNELDLRWSGAPPRVHNSGESAAPELCGVARPSVPAYGAFEDFAACTERGTQ